MNWDQIEGTWKQLVGSAKQQWAKLTDDDLTYISGKKDELIGKLQQHYGVSREEAERQADGWLSRAWRDAVESGKEAAKELRTPE